MMNTERNDVDLLDSQRLDSLVELLGSGLKEVVKEFLDSSHKRIAELKKANSSCNLNRMAKIVHTLKGSSANIGLTRLARSCEALEIDALNNCGITIPDQVEEIAKTHLLTCDALMKYIQDNISEE
ncbi:MAG: hypothetical protein BMS9Abin26_1196 [Gammaproteobacteria bacterium]|nr:MAG: hypothetical protein BMS9Abin26_1196 [Gammaproteobacteria bacterium]